MHIAMSRPNPAIPSTLIRPTPSSVSDPLWIQSMPEFSVPGCAEAVIAPINKTNDLAAEAQRFFASQVLSLMPRLRAFGFYLSHDHDKTNDLVQETVLKALRNQHQFTPGSNLVGWLMTILRNELYTTMRKRREVEDIDDMFSSRLSVAETQLHNLDLKQTMAAIQLLPDGQRSAVLFVAVLGYTCQEAADRCETKVGTIKSRLNRGRATLKRKLFLQ